MRIHFTVGVYQQHKEGEEEWTALVPGRYGAYISGTGETRLRHMTHPEAGVDYWKEEV